MFNSSSSHLSKSKMCPIKLSKHGSVAALPQENVLHETIEDCVLESMLPHLVMQHMMPAL